MFPVGVRAAAAAVGGGRAGVVFRPNSMHTLVAWTSSNCVLARSRRVPDSTTPRRRYCVISFHYYYYFFFSVGFRTRRRYAFQIGSAHADSGALYTFTWVVGAQHTIDFCQVAPVSYPFSSYLTFHKCPLWLSTRQSLFSISFTRIGYTHTHTHIVKRWLFGLTVVKCSPYNLNITQNHTRKKLYIYMNTFFVWTFFIINYNRLKSVQFQKMLYDFS